MSTVLKVPGLFCIGKTATVGLLQLRYVRTERVARQMVFQLLFMKES